MADWNGFKKNGTTYIPNDATARAGLQNKVDKVSGKGLSTNDYSDADKAIVDGVTSGLAGKVDKVTGKGLSTNDYDNTAKNIVDNIQDKVTDVYKVMGENGAKNLLPFVLNCRAIGFTSGGNKVGGGSFYMDDDGYITSKSNPNDDRTWVYDNCNFYIPLKAGDYKLRIEANTQASTNAGICLILPNDTKIYQKDSPALINAELNKDISITLSADTNLGVIYKVGNGAYRFNLRHAENTDISWSPYAYTNKEITDNYFSASANDIVGSKNLFDLSDFRTTTMDNGATVSGEGINFHIDGVTSPNDNGGIRVKTFSEDELPKGTYKICILKHRSECHFVSFVSIWKNSQEYQLARAVGGALDARGDYDEAEFTVDYDDYENVYVTFSIDVSNYTYDDDIISVTIKPASDNSKDFVPFAMTNKQLTDALYTRKEQMVAGARNLLNQTIDTSEFPKVIKGVTYTINSDGTILADGTATGGDANLVLIGFSDNKKFPDGKYVLTDNAGFINGNSMAFTGIHRRKNGANDNYLSSGNVDHKINFDVDNSVYNEYEVFIHVKEGTTVDNLLFKPMIRVYTNQIDDTYVPYALTNKELTDKIKANSSGTTVIPNPAGTATGNLNKVQIGTDIYDIPDTTYSDATTSASGLMSSTDKSKLNGIANNANNYSLPTAASGTKGGVKVGDGLTISNEILSNPSKVYSTSEKIIGKWTDGKTLYQKVVDTGSFPNATSKNVSTGLSNCTIRNIQIIGLSSSTGNQAPLPYIPNYITTHSYVDYQINSWGSQITIFSNFDASFCDKSYAIIEYTKNS